MHEADERKLVGQVKDLLTGDPPRFTVLQPVKNSEDLVTASQKCKKPAFIFSSRIAHFQEIPAMGTSYLFWHYFSSRPSKVKEQLSAPARLTPKFLLMSN